MKTKKVWKADAILFPNGNIRVIESRDDAKILKSIYLGIDKKIKFVTVEIKIIK